MARFGERDGLWLDLAGRIGHAAVMRKWRSIILAAAIVAVLGVIGWTVVSKPPDPVYAGHPVSYWVASGGSTPELDSNAVPYLVQALRIREGALRMAYERLWPHFPAWLRLRVWNPAAEVSTGMQCCGFLGNLKTGARPAIPELVRVLRADNNPGVRSVAAWALGRIANREDKPVVEALLGATKDTEAAVRQTAGAALIRINPEAAARAGVTNSPHP